jgi:hypothetical protein
MPLQVTAAIRDDRAVDACPLCIGADFYVRKDFDPKVGLTVVIVGAAISAVFYWFGRDLVAYGILAGAAISASATSPSATAVTPSSAEPIDRPRDTSTCTRRICSSRSGSAGLDDGKTMRFQISEFRLQIDLGIWRFGDLGILGFGQSLDCRLQ